jgi:hypothetical protein
MLERVWDALAKKEKNLWTWLYRYGFCPGLNMATCTHTRALTHTKTHGYTYTRAIHYLQHLMGFCTAQGENTTVTIAIWWSCGDYMTVSNPNMYFSKKSPVKSHS